MRGVSISLLWLALLLGACAGTQPGGLSTALPTSAEAPGTVRIGAGFAAGQAGRVVTAFHVVRECTAIEVDDGSRLWAAQLVWRDARSDVAVLDVDPAARLRVHAVGNAVPLDSVTAVIPRALAQTPLAGTMMGASPVRSGQVEVILDGAVPQGASGSPVLDASGAAVAVLVGRWSLQANMALAAPMPPIGAAGVQPGDGARVARVSCAMRRA